MANIFTLENVSDFSEKINIDELYEKKKKNKKKKNKKKKNEKKQ